MSSDEMPQGWLTDPRWGWDWRSVTSSDASSSQHPSETSDGGGGAVDTHTRDTPSRLSQSSSSFTSATTRTQIPRVAPKPKQTFSAFGATIPSNNRASNSPGSTRSNSNSAAKRPLSGSDLSIEKDVHAHPCPVCPPASAFSIYRVSLFCLRGGNTNL